MSAVQEETEKYSADKGSFYPSFVELLVYVKLSLL